MFLFGWILLLPTAARAFISPLSRSRAMNTACRMAVNNASGSSISIDSLAEKKILVVGGSGRVGGSVAAQLVKYKSHVTVGGTRLESFQAAKARWSKRFANLRDIDFCALNKENSTSIVAVLENDDYDLVVNTAGPFQGKVNVPNGVLEACVAKSVPYIDVCDDYCTAMAAKAKFAKAAQEGGVPCIISTGCWVRVLRFIVGYGA
jgi:short subunit dehydrogenase-like uncharacterized protein